MNLSLDSSKLVLEALRLLLFCCRSGFKHFDCVVVQLSKVCCWLEMVLEWGCGGFIPPPQPHSYLEMGLVVVVKRVLGLGLGCSSQSQSQPQSQEMPFSSILGNSGENLGCHAFREKSYFCRSQRILT